MPDLEVLKRKIKTAEELTTIVQTMKVMSAASIRQYEDVIQAVGENFSTVESGLQILLRGQKRKISGARPAPSQHVGIIVIGSDQGMCGGYNEQLAVFVRDNESRVTAGRLTRLVLGEQLERHFAPGSADFRSTFGVSDSVAGIAPLVHQLLIKIDSWQADLGVDEVLLFHNEPTKSVPFVPSRRQLLPLDPIWQQEIGERSWPSKGLPVFSMPWDQLFASLIRHYLFISLYRAIAESLSSEHASRLMAMQNAEQNIMERLSEKRAEFRHQRQSVITEEILDIMAGFEALTTHPF
jgi:F-type H+-transporting ATPase subunit gamma